MGEIDAVPVDPVHLEDEDHIPPVHLGEHALVFGTGHRTAGVTLVAVDVDDLPTADRTVRLQTLFLRIEGETVPRLVLGGDPGIYRYA